MNFVHSWVFMTLLVLLTVNSWSWTTFAWPIIMTFAIIRGSRFFSPMLHGSMKAALPSSELQVFKLSFETFWLIVLVLHYVTITLSMSHLSVDTSPTRVIRISDRFHCYNPLMLECMAAIPMILLCSSVLKRPSIVAASKI